MKILKSWVSEFLADEIENKEFIEILNSLGLVVEKVDKFANIPDSVVIARVVSINPIKGATKIKQVEVDVDGEIHKVVCGANNFEIGDIVAYAMGGSKLGNLVIAKKEIMGVISDGMLCSAKELGLGEDQSGLLILGERFDNIESQPLSQLLSADSDLLLELEVSPNRPDALCHFGIARDISAKLKVKLKEIDYSVEEDDDEELVSLESDYSLCDVLTGRKLSCVNSRLLSYLVSIRLSLCGIRPINAIVDATNYALLEIGQPTHAYDLSKLPSAFLRARAAVAGEQILCLDEKVRNLGLDIGQISNLTGDCVITDSNDSAIGIGGIIGGKESEVDLKTNQVLLESAHFDPRAINRTSRRLGLRTEASLRFERGCDPELAELASNRVAQLIKTRDSGAKIGKINIVRKDLKRNVISGVNLAKINKTLGTNIDESEIAGYIKRLGFEVKPSLEGNVDVIVPSFRPDIVGINDLAEEVGRLYGYENISSVQFKSPFVGRLSKKEEVIRRLKASLKAAQFVEVWSSTFVKKGIQAKLLPKIKEIELVNPMNSHESALRASIVFSVMRFVKENLNRGFKEFSLFEIGNVFERDETLEFSVKETTELAAVVVSDSKEFAFNQLMKALVIICNDSEVDLSLKPSTNGFFSSSNEIEFNGNVIGVIGSLRDKTLKILGQNHPVDLFLLDVDKLCSVQKIIPQPFVPSKFPEAEFDLAFVVKKNVFAEEIRRTLLEAGPTHRIRCWLFDSYTGAPLNEDERSLAFRIKAASTEGTLTEADIADIRRMLISKIQSKFGGRLR